MFEIKNLMNLLKHFFVKNLMIFLEELFDQKFDEFFE